MKGLNISTPLAAFGTLADLSTITPSFDATSVYVGTALEGELQDHIIGVVAAALTGAMHFVHDQLATGTKSFLDPHPTDPNLVIAYVSLEGPEAGTYFRGRGRIQNGIARITVPEHFRLVTDPEGLTVQITPIGPMASFSVVKYDLNEIVVQSSRNVARYWSKYAICRLLPTRTSPVSGVSSPSSVFRLSMR